MKDPIGIWITDTHLTENTIEVNFSVFDQVFNLCDQLGIKQVFHGGDIFTSRKGQPEIVLNAFKKILDIAKERDIHIIAIPGNHDKTSYVSSSSYLYAFDGHPAFTALEDGGIMDFGNMLVHFLPYYDESLLYSEKLSQLELSQSGLNILLTHVGIDGVKNNGHVNVENSLKQNMFDRFDLVLVGHYHDRQVLGSKNQIVYTGSAYQANFGEDGNKGCTVLYSDGSYEFIGLEFPEYITVEVLPKDIDADLVQMIRNKTSEAKIKIKIQQDVEDDKKGMVAELESFGVKVEVQKQSFSPVSIVTESQVAFTANDILQEYDNWSTDRKVESAEFGKELLKEVL